MLAAYTTDELNAKFRTEVDDLLEGVDDSEPDSDSLWKNAEIYEYMTEAADAVARGTQSLFKLVELPVVAAENVVKLPRSVLQIRFARLVAANSEVCDANQDELVSGSYVCDYGIRRSGAILAATGRPRRYARDRERKALVLAPTPTENDTLELQCTVTLSAPLLCGMPLPFGEPEDQRLMLHYMKYLAYAKQDADVLDLSRSESFKAKFDNEVSARESELRRYRRTPSPIRMEW